MNGLAKKLVVEKGLNTTVERMPLKGIAAHNLPYKLGFRHVLSINFLILTFFVPLATWLIIAYTNESLLNSIMPFSANLGLGISVAPDVYAVSAYQKLINDFYGSLIMVPLIMVASLGLAGGLDAVKLLIWPPKEAKTLTRVFFQSLKRNFGLFLISALIISILVGLLKFSFNAYAVNGSAMDIITIILASILLLFTITVTMFYVTQGSAYKQKTFDRLKNSVILTFIKPHLNILASVASVLPIVLFAFYENIMLLALIFFIFMGFFYVVGVWVVHAHGVFDIYFNAPPVKTLNPQKKVVKK